MVLSPAVDVYQQLAEAHEKIRRLQLRIAQLQSDTKTVSPAVWMKLNHITDSLSTVNRALHDQRIPGAYQDAHNNWHVPANAKMLPASRGRKKG